MSEWRRDDDYCYDDKRGASFVREKKKPRCIYGRPGGNLWKKLAEHTVFGREWECFSRVNASVAASVVLARRQHLVACIRPRARPVPLVPARLPLRISSACYPHDSLPRIIIIIPRVREYLYHASNIYIHIYIRTYTSRKNRMIRRKEEPTSPLLREERKSRASPRV